ncbi:MULTISPECIES: hypothetical protein [Pseudomonas]|uniref:Fap system outer membrane protein n=1 Tax=Pseudomonas synxantha TaxID=47883 RepID=A0A5D3G8J5_9PSED|nr:MULTISPECIES: hypothetical protein [Pseudomonas]KFF42565.1 hypothetical protein JH25_01870 [Pseudomonas sp. BRG-100]MBY8972716.1 hypothetical protein [Pseudomonas sp. P867]MCK3827693.1 hypothetical protein [Pseudomonas sp. W2Aug9]MCK3833672.1 hypothetical protein [Pseudomonas fluorescens]MCK3853650.1 hypothetical protein [Pseudomonas sp. W2Jun17]
MNTFRWLTVLCLAASMPAYASSAFKPIELNDAQMADLRGRYVMPGRIISFGIVMSSTWTNAVGDRITGTANMQIDKTTVTPQFYVQTTGSTGNGSLPNTGTGNVVGGAGLGSGQGVTQSVRTAGDGNTAYNDVGISIENGVAPASNLQTGQVLMAGGTVTGDSAAGRVSVSANNGGVQMAIQANHNQGNSLQQIGGGNVLQGTVLTGNSNLVRNITQLNVVMNNNGLNNGALNCNLDQLKGLRTLGY